MKMSSLKGTLAFLLFVGVCFSAKLTFRPLDESKNFETEVTVTDEHGTGVAFDGIGGISGGGATSKLLVNYPEKQRNEVLDFLFKPNYAASLQILKVEIGGDSQSTDGSEASHMHEPDSENYHRGYEWWMMKEAKKRNPNIKLYGLPWVFPGWLRDEQNRPYANMTALAQYYLKWIKGAKTHHNLDIDYIGIWNERPSEPEFVKMLRKALNEEGLSHVHLVVRDAHSWDILDKFAKDPEYLKAIDIIGLHYPAVTSPERARHLGKKLWASEDFSTHNNLRGGGCWARVLTEGPVNGHFSAFIAWNLIASYYDGMPYSRDGLMTANQPWSGFYSVDSPIWSSAHHTFFYQPGWKYLPHGSGLGVLNGNGSYITLVSPDHADMTMVISTMDPKNAACAYHMPQFSVAPDQKATFKLGGNLKNIKKLYVWYTYIDYETEKKSTFFEERMPINVVDGKFTVNLKKNAVVTLTTVKRSKPHTYPEVPESKRFPVPYYEDFEGMDIGVEPYNFAPQSGAYEVTMSNDPKHKKVMTQVVIRPPIDTCKWKMDTPPILIGDFQWKDVHVKVDAFVDKNDKNASTGVYLASQVDQGGCDIDVKEGIYLWINIKEGVAELCLNYNCTHSVDKNGLPKNLYNTWFTMALNVQGKHIEAKIDDKVIFDVVVEKLYSSNGFVVLGPNKFGRASFDNFAITKAKIR